MKKLTNTQIKAIKNAYDGKTVKIHIAADMVDIPNCGNINKDQDAWRTCVFCAEACRQGR